MMAENGENTKERPMWAEKGGLDFGGRAQWDAWTALKGMKTDRAKLEFVRVGARSACPPGRVMDLWERCGRLRVAAWSRAWCGSLFQACAAVLAEWARGICIAMTQAAG